MTRNRKILEAVLNGQSFKSSEVCMQHSGRKLSILDLLPTERDCCGTLNGSHHRATCPKYRGKHKPAND